MEQHVDCLRVQLERAVQLAFLVGLVGLSEAGAHISVLILDLLDVGKEFANVSGLERKVLVVAEDVLFSQGLWCRSLLLPLALRSGSRFLLEGLVEIGNDGFDLIAEQVLLALVALELDSNDLAQVTHQGSLVVDCRQAAQFLLLCREFMSELHSGNLLDLLVYGARGEAEEARWDETVEAT